MGIGYIPYNKTAPQQPMGFGTTLAATTLSLNKFREVFEPSLGISSQNSIGSFYNFINSNACGPELPGTKANVSIADFSQCSAFIAAIQTQNIAQNEYGTAATGSINVTLTKGTVGVGNGFEIVLTGGTGSTTATGVTTHLFNGLGGATSVLYTVTVSELPAEPTPSTEICPAVFRVNVVSEAAIPHVQRISPAAGPITNFSNPSKTALSSAVSLYNATNTYNP